MTWLHREYPTWDQLAVFADERGIRMVENGTPRAAFLPPDSGGPLILIPIGLSPLARMWSLAHELGHALLHAGPIPLSTAKQEREANHWAARALIPETRIQEYQNASLDAFIGALSAHYEDIPYTNSATRKLASRIARYRLQALDNVRPL